MSKGEKKNTYFWNGHTFLARVVSTHPLLVSTQGYQILRQSHEEMVKCVDTVPSSVDTRPSSKRTQLIGWDSMSTQSQAVSTLVTSPRGPVLQKWDSVSTHSMVRSTHSGNVFTLSPTWTRGTLGILWIGLGSCAHAPQGYFWTHWAINTLLLAIQKKRTPQSLPEKFLWRQDRGLLPILALLVLLQANSHPCKH
ncbi:hypothetical protein Taro_000630 [Colocasia esculenta]|uniref:Uncharacterized protein n=1 Tax=Colocasia esculenta TaxID=4460 RepID=A0A843TI84_COLES|nr:hypothetical protein [Colocasia esculenta]